MTAPTHTSNRNSQPSGGQTPQVAPYLAVGGKSKFSLWVFGLFLLFSVWGLIHRLASGPPVGIGAYGDTSAAVFRYYFDCYPILYILMVAFLLGLFVMMARNHSPPD